MQPLGLQKEQLCSHKSKGNMSAFYKMTDLVGHLKNVSHPIGWLSFQTKLFPYHKGDNSLFSQQPRGPAAHLNSPRMSLVSPPFFYCNPSLQKQWGEKQTLTFTSPSNSGWREYCWGDSRFKDHLLWVFSGPMSFKSCELQPVSLFTSKFSWLVSIYSTNIYWVFNICCGCYMQRFFYPSII